MDITIFNKLVFICSNDIAYTQRLKLALQDIKIPTSHTYVKTQCSDLLQELSKTSQADITILLDILFLPTIVDTFDLLDTIRHKFSKSIVICIISRQEDMGNIHIVQDLKANAYIIDAGSYANLIDILNRVKTNYIIDHNPKFSIYK